MRLHKNNIDEQSRNQIRQFAEWILQISDNAISCIEGNDNDDEERDWIEIPQNLLVKHSEYSIQSIIEAIYPQFQLNYANPEYFRQRAIITVYNQAINTLNEIINQKN